jgi:hypothetical protein
VINFGYPRPPLHDTPITAPPQRLRRRNTHHRFCKITASSTPHSTFFAFLLAALRFTFGSSSLTVLNHRFFRLSHLRQTSAPRQSSFTIRTPMPAAAASPRQDVPSEEFSLQPECALGSGNCPSSSNSTNQPGQLAIRMRRPASEN